MKEVEDWEEKEEEEDKGRLSGEEPAVDGVVSREEYIWMRKQQIATLQQLASSIYVRDVPQARRKIERTKELLAEAMDAIDNRSEAMITRAVFALGSAYATLSFIESNVFANPSGTWLWAQFEPASTENDHMTDRADPASAE